jgi:hypothetical protein
MKVEQEEVTTAIAAGRSVAQGDDTAAAEATVRLARRAGPDAVKFLRRVIVTEGGWASVPQRVRASCALLEVGGHLGGSLSSETRSNAAFREPEGTDAGAGARETS